MQFDFYDMQIGGTDDDPKVADVEVDLVMTEPADPGIAPSLNHPGEPPWPATFDVEEVRLTHRETGLFGETITTLKLTEMEFTTFFPQGADIINNAYEWASEQETD